MNKILSSPMMGQTLVHYQNIVELFTEQFSHLGQMLRCIVFLVSLFLNLFILRVVHSDI